MAVASSAAMVDERQSVDGELAEALFVEMIRAGILSVEIVERVAAGFRHKAATAGTHESADRAATIEAMAQELVLKASVPDAIDLSAAGRRRAIRDRTAFIARQTDGGSEG